MSGPAVVQVNIRAPEADKAVLADVAARLREGGGFADRLSDFLAADGAGAAWADRLAEIERRLAALEVFQSLQDATDAAGKAVDRISALGGCGADIGR